MEILLKRWVSVTLIGLLAVATLFAIVWVRFTSDELSKSRGSKVITLKSETLRGGAKWNYVTQKDVMNSFESGRGSAATTHKKYLNIEEAVKVYAYAKAPKNSLGRSILGIFDSVSPVGLAIFYENGLLVKQRKLDPGEIQPNAQERVRAELEAKQEGTLKSDAVPILIDVNGIQGVGCEPGYNLIDGNKDPRPGFVSWVENRVEYTIGGENISLDQLLEVARSIK